MIDRNAELSRVGDDVAGTISAGAHNDTQIKSYSIINKLVEVFGNWLRHRQEIREIRDLDSAEFANIAHDLCINPADLDTFVRQGPHAVDELPKLLMALGIDEKVLSRTQPLVLRDMARVCASCQQKHQCDRDLGAGTSATLFVS